MSCGGWEILPKEYGHLHGGLQNHFCEFALVVTQSLWDSASARRAWAWSGDRLKGFLYRARYCPLVSEICSTWTVVGVGVAGWSGYWYPGPETKVAVLFGLGDELL